MNKDQLGRLTACIAAISLIATLTRAAYAQVPTPPPECPAGKVSALRNFVYYANSSEQLFIFAEFCNATSSSIRQVQALIHFYNDAGEGVETFAGPNFPYADQDYAPGARWCVGYFLPIKPLGMSYLEIGEPSYEAADHVQAPITALTATVDITALRILGRLRNDHAAEIRGLNVQVSMYDRKGRVIGCGQTSVNSTSLMSQQVTTFVASFLGYGSVTDSLYADYAGYHIWADALELGKLPIHLPQVMRQIAPTRLPTPTPDAVDTSKPPIPPTNPAPPPL